MASDDEEQDEPLEFSVEDVMVEDVMVAETERLKGMVLPARIVPPDEMRLADLSPDMLAAIFGGSERVTRNEDGSYTHTYTPPEYPKPRYYITVERVEDSDTE